MLNCVILGIRHLANLTTAMPLFERKSCTYEKQSSYFHFHWVQWLECREVHNSFWCSHCATAKPTGWPIFGQTSIIPEELLLYVGFQKTLWMFRVGSFYLDPRFKIKAPRHLQRQMQEEEEWSPLVIWALDQLVCRQMFYYLSLDTNLYIAL